MKPHPTLRLPRGRRKYKLNADVTPELLAQLDRVTAQIPLLSRHKTHVAALRLGLALLDGDPVRLLREVQADIARPESA